MPVVPETLRSEYLAQMSAHRAALAERMTRNQVDYAVFETSRPLDHALFAYLSRRERLSRVR
jgi:molybdopterin-guanine dinucleotide biosynthesis protein A